MMPQTKQGSCLVSLVSFWLHIHQEYLFSVWCLQQGHNHSGCCWAPSDYSIYQEYFFLLNDVFTRVRRLSGNSGFLLNFPSPQESPLNFTWTLPFPHFSRQLFLPYNFLSMISSWTLFYYPFHLNMDSSFTLPFPATCSRHFVFSFPAFITGSFSFWSWWWFPMLSLRPYGLVIIEDKSHICKVFAAILISTNHCLIPGIWSLAPASTMVRLRLQRAATKSSCPTGVKPRIPRGQQGIPRTARARARIGRDRAGIARDRAGIAWDRTGISRDRAGIAGGGQVA